MRYAYFPGCSASSTGLSYTLSYKYVAGKTGIEMNEIPDWNCCGAADGRKESQDLGDALPARSLALSEEAYGDAPVLALCAGCYLQLKIATDRARKDDETRRRIEGIIDRPWSAAAEVANALEPFLDEGVRGRVVENVTKPLEGLKVACYYGCALLRPHAVLGFDDVEQPHTMEDVVALTGATPIDRAFKNECCGSSHQVAIPAAGRTMVRRILENAAASGAGAVACACPLCMLNLDMREKEINAARLKEGKPALDLPIYYFTELIGASFGADAKTIGTNRHFHPAADVHERARASREAAEAKAQDEKERAAAEKARAAAERAQARKGAVA